jgi:hypothetical protein
VKGSSTNSRKVWEIREIRCTRCAGISRSTGRRNVSTTIAWLEISKEELQNVWCAYLLRSLDVRGKSFQRCTNAACAKDKPLTALLQMNVHMVLRGQLKEIRPV